MSGRLTELLAADASAAMAKAEGWADQYRRYLCPSCQAQHRDEHDAEICCPPEVEEVWVAPDGEIFETAHELEDHLSGDGDTSAPICPVCHQLAVSISHAADCCLWKTYGVDVRYLIYRAVENGKTWSEAIALHGGSKQ